MSNVIPLRSIEHKWKCKRSGDCCHTPVQMLQKERDAIEGYLRDHPYVADPAALHWTALPPRQNQPGWSLGPLPPKSPCPFLGFLVRESGERQALCKIYPVRPAVCRIFMCGRPDVKAEPLEDGCANTIDRLHQSLDFREQYRTNFRHAMREWGDKVGWAGADPIIPNWDDPKKRGLL